MRAVQQGLLAVVLCASPAAAMAQVTIQPQPVIPVQAQTSGTAQTAPQQYPASATASVYQINAGDELEIYVWGEERLQRMVRVLPDGTIGFPLVGQLVVQGRTLSDLETMISERLRNQYRGQVPQVTASVKAPMGLQFSVMGNVKSAGTFSPGRYVNVLEALSLAGGPAEFANLDNVIIIRKVGDRIVTLRARLSGVFRGSAGSNLDNAAIQRIQSGDTVIVP
jgi:polysaccharide biosynthesis/export protein